MSPIKVAYPAAGDRADLSDSLLALKIARHSPCTRCPSVCSGLQPPLGYKVVTDDRMEHDDFDDLFGDSDDEGSSGPPSSYLEMCSCGHDVSAHNADLRSLDRQEFERRGKVAIRIDEFFKDSGRLDDFSYTDEDIVSLRKQMVIPGLVRRPSAALSSPTQHRSQSVTLSPTSSLSELDPSSSRSLTSKTRKRRASSSSLSEADTTSHPSMQEVVSIPEDEDSDSDDDEKPLASRLTAGSSTGTSRSVVGGGKAKPPGKRAHPGGPSHGGKSGGHPAKKAKKTHTVTDESKNAVNGKTTHTKIKEEKVDDVSLAATAAAARGPAAPRAEKISSVEMRRGVIQVIPVSSHSLVSNEYAAKSAPDLATDSHGTLSNDQARNLIVLTGLKTLFQKQLPMMPREYIARLVYDCNSRSLAIIKKGYKVVGGICFRPFEQRGFAEIVFFATNSADQEKGYGGMLMDHFKAHIRKTYPGMQHFLTYADNFAVGYFEKQGFSKEITLAKSVWAGYIKDYEGGTIMQCTMVPKVDYLNKKAIWNAQKEAVVAKVKSRSRSHIVHPGLACFMPGAGWEEGQTLDPKDVPGLKESGWNPEFEQDLLNLNLKSPDYHLMEKTLQNLIANPNSWPFHAPVNTDEVTDYLDVITHPMDFATMEKKLTSNQYKNVEQFVDDALLVFDNCRAYNPETSPYYKKAQQMEKALKEALPGYVRRD